MPLLPPVMRAFFPASFIIPPCFGFRSIGYVSRHTCFIDDRPGWGMRETRYLVNEAAPNMNGL
jgi:hypothetical protein